MKKYVLPIALAAMLPLGLHAAPVSLVNTQADMTGKMSVKGTGKCYGRAASAGKVSPVELTASIRFGASDQINGEFDWFNDSTSIADTTGDIIDRRGNKLTLAFDSEAATALLAIANIPPSSGGAGGSGLTVDSYSMTGVATKKTMTVTEKVVMKISMPPACEFRWTIKRKLKGPLIPVIT
jgi:hypothetical protein